MANTPEKTKLPAGPLTGVRVLDFSMYVAGPYCTRLMADMGAEVIKIEPLGGELMRKAPPFHRDKSSYFGHLNCGKKSVELDLKQPIAIKQIHQLMSTVDVVLENYRPGVMAKFGLDFKTLKKIKPNLIFCSISGFGQTGPDSDRAAFATIINASSGFDMMMMQYEPALNRPLRHRSNAPDFMGSTHACSAICASLFGRERTGLGQRIDVAMIDTIHNMMAHEYQAAQIQNPTQAPVFAPLTTKDGFIMVAPVSQANFLGLAKALKRGDWVSDRRYANATERMDNWDTFLEEIGREVINFTAAEAERLINAAGCPCAQYLTIKESINQPRVRERGASVAVNDGAQIYNVANTPMLFDTSTVGAQSWVALSGQHNEEILSELG